MKKFKRVENANLDDIFDAILCMHMNEKKKKFTFPYNFFIRALMHCGIILFVSFILFLRYPAIDLKFEL